MRKFTGLALVASLGCAVAAQAAHHEGMDNKAVAKGWVEASCGDLAGFTYYVNKHMAEDGHFMPARYVGLGFTMDADEPDAAISVMMVTPGTPAAAVLQEGDEFVSVNGVPATWENRGKLNFRGEPGEPVAAVIRRNGEEMAVEIERGVIASMNDKAMVMRGLSMADAEDWPSDSCEVVEVVQEGPVVYVSFNVADTESDTGTQWQEHRVSRLEFNDEGKIAKAWTRGESRFVLEQLGYTISR